MRGRIQERNHLNVVNVIRLFLDKSNLMKHEMSHTGDKIFRCSTCEKTF